MDARRPPDPKATAQALVECWQEVNLDIWIDYAQSMPDRIAAVIAANGEATAY